MIAAYVQGLRDRDKPYKCAIVAAMRKLLIHLQCLIKKSQLATSEKPRLLRVSLFLSSVYQVS